MISLLLVFALGQATAMPNKSLQSAQDKVKAVCDIVRNPDAYDGQTVTVEAFVAAGLHATVLKGDRCGKGIYMVNETGRTSGLWPEFDNKLARKATGLDKKPLLVKVRGVYHARVRLGPRTVRQLKVLDVLGVDVRAD